MRISTPTVRMLNSALFAVFAYTISFAQPVIINFSPTYGPYGTAVTINGSGFNPVAANNNVYFGGMIATVTSASSNQLTVIAPSGSTDSNITVITGGLQVVSKLSFIATSSSPLAVTTASIKNTAQNFSLSKGHIEGAVGDFNRDNKVDFVTVHGSNDLIEKNRSTSSGNLNVPATFATANESVISWENIKQADMDGDGWMDIVGSAFPNLIGVKRNLQSGNIDFGTVTSITMPYSYLTEPFIADMNRDGRLDIVTYAYNDYRLIVAINTSSPGNISFSAPFTVTGSALNSLFSPKIDVGDFNSDGKTDIIVQDRWGNNSLIIFQNNYTSGPMSEASFGSGVSFASNTDTNLQKNMQCKDVDRDGNIDIVSIFADGEIRIFRNLMSTSGETITASSFSVPVVVPSGGTPFSPFPNPYIQIANFDLDTKPDLIAGTEIGIFYYKNNTTPGSISGSDFSAPIGFTAASIPDVSLSESPISVADINQDGKPDLVTTRSGVTPASSLATFRYNLSKQDQVVSFSPIANKTLGDPIFILSATASSGLTSFTYTSSNPAVATVSSNVVSIVGAGTTTITASQIGSTFFNQAQAIQTLTVNKAPQTLSFSNLNDTFIGAPPLPISVSSSSGLLVSSFTSSNPSVASMSGNIITYNSAGTTTITATQAGNGNYEAASVSRTITVSKNAQLVDIFGGSYSFNYGPITLNATATSGLPITFTSDNTAVATVSGNIATITGVGTTRITATQNGNEIFEAASDSFNMIITKGYQGLELATMPSKFYGDPPFSLPANVTNSGLLVTYSSSNPAVAQITSGNTVTIVGAGSTTISATQAGNENWFSASDFKTLTVFKASQSITFNPLTTKAFGDIPFTLSATASSGLALNYTSSNTAVATVSGNTVTIIGAGSTTITASQIGNANYNAATDVTQTLTVNKANQTITFNALTSKTFGDAAFNLSATTSSGLSPAYTSSNTGVATVSGNTVTIVGAGSTVITASQSGNSNYNAATDITQTLTVNKANQTITFNALTAKTFGDAAFNLTATASSSLPVSYTSSNTGVATVSGNTVTIVGAGSTVITASQSGNTNYNAATAAAQPLTVNKANQTITFIALTAKTFGDAEFNLTATASSGLTPAYTSSNTAVATVSGSTVTIVGAGSTTITASQSGDSNYNSASNKTQTLTVNKANQTITFGPLTPKTFIDLAFSLNAAASSNLEVSYSSSNTSVATVNGSTITIVGVGNTLITASQAGDTNYNGATSVSQSLTVNKADQTIVFGAIGAKNQSDLPFQLTASTTSGLSITYTSSNPAVATISGNTVTIVAPGTTDITASQSGNANFNAATNVVRSLVVNTKTAQTITFASLSNKVFGDPNFNLSATASSGLPVSFTSSNPAVATVSGNTVTIVAAGTTNIVASQSGDNTFNNATDIIRSLVVSKANQTITFAALGQVSITQASVPLAATSSVGLPIVFSSSNNSVASVNGTTLTLNGIGSANITAEQAGNNNYNSATAVSTIVVSEKLSQTIAFTPIPDKIIGGSSFSLTATASSNLPIVFTTTSDKVSIAGNVVTILKAGRVVITATQAGDNIYNAASIDQSFCIAPSKLTITISNNFSDTPTLTASTAANYQWYKNNVLIPGATSQTFSVTDIGQYKVSTKADDCSTASDVFAIVVTANEPVLPNSDLPVEVFPNPADDYFHVHGIIGKFEYRLSSIIGSTIPIKLEKEGADYKGYIGSLPQGYYVLTIKQPTRTQSIKILKK